MDTELRDALSQLAEDLRGEIRSGDAETRAYIDASAAETRRHSGVIGESLRGEIRALAEAMAINNEGTQRRFSEEAGRTDRFEGAGPQTRGARHKPGRQPEAPSAAVIATK